MNLSRLRAGFSGRRPRRLLQSWSMLALVLLLGAPSWASGLVIASEASSATVKPHTCACGMGCKDRCCCEPDKPSSPPPSHRQTVEPKATNILQTSPFLMRSRPCGGSLPNTESPTVRMIQWVAKPVDSETCRTPRVSRVAPPSSDTRPTKVSQRLDDPPDWRV